MFLLIPRTILEKLEILDTLWSFERSERMSQRQLLIAITFQYLTAGPIQSWNQNAIYNPRFRHRKSPDKTKRSRYLEYR